MTRYTRRQRNHDTRHRVCAQLVARGLGPATAWALTMRTPYRLLRLVDMQFAVSKMLDTPAPYAVGSDPSSPPPLT
jgi:hypothetical protein